MATLKEVQACLYENPHLTEEVKESMDILIQIFNKKLPEVDLTNLMNNLKTLDFEATSKFVSNIPLYYDDKRNKLVIVKSELEKDLRRIDEDSSLDAYLFGFEGWKG